MHSFAFLTAKTRKELIFECLIVDLVKAKKRYYPQTLLEECKYELIKIKMENLIGDNLELKSSDESDSKSDNDSNDETDLTMNKIMMNPKGCIC